MFEGHIALFYVYSQWMALAVRQFVAPIALEIDHGVGVDLAHVHDFDIPLHAIDLSEVEAAHVVKLLFWVCRSDRNWFFGHKACLSWVDSRGCIVHVDDAVGCSVLGTETLLCDTLAVVGIDWNTPTISMTFPDNDHSPDMTVHILVILSLVSIPSNLEFHSLAEMPAFCIPSTFVEEHRKYSANHEEPPRVSSLLVSMV